MTRRSQLKQWIFAAINFLTSSLHSPWWMWLRFCILIWLDILIVAASYYTAFVLRLDDLLLSGMDLIFWQTLPIVVGVHIAVFFLGGMYRQIWRYANFKSAILVGKLVLSATVLASGIIFLRSDIPPRSVPFIYLTLVVTLQIVEKFCWRGLLSLTISLSDVKKERCLIYGAGTSGELLARYISTTQSFPYKAVGFIDDDPNKRNRVIHGIRILGAGMDLTEIAQTHDIHTIIIALHAAPGQVLRKIIRWCNEAKLAPLIMPNLANSMADDLPGPRPVNINDLLCRSPRSVERGEVTRFFGERTVLVTGAGGSIGSEICRQILEAKPKKLILLDSCEYNLYAIDTELSTTKPKSELICILGTVTDSNFIEDVFRNQKPDCVLHAAAYKHVPLVEANSIVSITNNIRGTQVVANACIAHGVKNFLLISSDKAVRPTNVMGMTKRVCEILVQSQNSQKTTCSFSAVRFGNVLGSSGSVIPRFLDQIKNGGPVTVTDLRVTRYFMLISEAVGLVLQSAARASGGEIFVLDMGDPVNIHDMAKQLICLAGKQPGVDIEITFTGLRPGEKLFEELLIEGLEQHKLEGNIFVARPEEFSSSLALNMIAELLKHAENRNEKSALHLLSELASTHFHEKMLAWHEGLNRSSPRESSVSQHILPTVS
jgi:FlaA1/EpsC-like NDP-sugar epimerase